MIRRIADIHVRKHGEVEVAGHLVGVPLHINPFIINKHLELVGVELFACRRDREDVVLVHASPRQDVPYVVGLHLVRRRVVDARADAELARKVGGIVTHSVRYVDYRVLFPIQGRDQFACVRRRVRDQLPQYRFPLVLDHDRIRRALLVVEEASRRLRLVSHPRIRQDVPAVDDLYVGRLPRDGEYLLAVGLLGRRRARDEQLEEDSPRERVLRHVQVPLEIVRLVVRVEEGGEHLADAPEIRAPSNEDRLPLALGNVSHRREEGNVRTRPGLLVREVDADLPVAHRGPQSLLDHDLLVLIRYRLQGIRRRRRRGRSGRRRRRRGCRRPGRRPQAHDEVVVAR
mmetsp:Transcript_19312/g.45200  ORF Transcript_19312/g.45200 Transcript_19312/m.45200 type:complete len:343 (+) Transcript_19312:243-1271(+)